MNKRNYIKICMLLVLGLCIFTGCSPRQDKTYTMEELDNIAKIEIYSAKNDKLIKTINDENQIYQYNHCVFSDDSDTEEYQEDLKKSIEGADEQYYFISYKYSAAHFSRQKTEKNSTITLYENSNIVKMTVSEESVKNISLPEEFLTFYYEISDEDMEFYHSLIEE